MGDELERELEKAWDMDEPSKAESDVDFGPFARGFMAAWQIWERKEQDRINEFNRRFENL